MNKEFDKAARKWVRIRDPKWKPNRYVVPAVIDPTGHVTHIMAFNREWQEKNNYPTPSLLESSGTTPMYSCEQYTGKPDKADGMPP